MNLKKIWLEEIINRERYGKIVKGRETEGAVDKLMRCQEEEEERRAEAKIERELADKNLAAIAHSDKATYIDAQRRHTRSTQSVRARVRSPASSTNL